MTKKQSAPKKKIDLLKEALSNDKRLWSEGEGGKRDFNLAMLVNLTNKIDAKIISTLLKIADFRKAFFVDVGDACVFLPEKFQFFAEENQLDNSYTAYKNRIGLSDRKRLISERNDVVLDFPYKDCVLEGGQSTEEGFDTYYERESGKDKTAGNYVEKSSKRQEVFFNQTLAQDEIDRLLDEKTLCAWKRYGAQGKKEAGSIARDKNGVICENMVIKGNNLLALHSLTRQFAGKIKLAYVDPPYNTGGNKNIFSYNNTFNHSTWLTFMKNRLEALRLLLREDGFVAIAIDHAELFYVGALADEIFGRENRLGIVTVVVKREGRQFSEFFSASTDYMVVYAKNKEMASFENVRIENEENGNNGQAAEGEFNLRRFINYNKLEISGRNVDPDSWYPFYVSEDLTQISLQPRQKWIEVFPIDKGKEKTWQTQKKTAQKRLDAGKFVCHKNANGDPEILYKAPAKQRFVTHWTNKRYNSASHGTKVVENLIGKNGFSYPKSLYTVMDTLKIMTKKDDIILDCHAGSGTTAHAAHALNTEDGGQRKVILVEQLEEHLDICVKRLQELLRQQKSQDSFLYFELAKCNERAKDRINACDGYDDLVAVFSEVYDAYFLNYNLKGKSFLEKTILEPEFKALSVNKQKRIFLSMLDLNMLYVPKSEMADPKHGIAAKDQKLCRQFYGEEK